MVIKVIFVVMCLLVSQAKGLECITCTNVTGSCSEPSVQCSANVTDSCASITSTSVSGDSISEGNIKGCISSAQCLNGSLNLGSVRVTLSTSCCNTDNCNTGSPPAAVNNTANGRQCFTCDSTGCSSTIQCAGDEDRCVSTTISVDGQSTAVKGCATQSICSGGVSQELGSMSAEITCCEGDLCNVLECITCASASGSCSGDSEECPSSDTDSCASITTRKTVVGDSIVERNEKRCVPSAQCLSGSLNLGISKYTLSTSCCNTDNCNTGSPPVNNTANGRECFSCVLTDCSSRIPCAGDEDRCVTGTVNLAGLNSTVKGCATQNVCSGAFSQELNSEATELTCCEGDLCNTHEGLECITCASASGSCSGPSVQCPALVTPSCVSITSSTTVLGISTAERDFKRCIPSVECLDGSLNYGISRVTLNTLCCNTDECNTGSPSAAVNNTANGRQCLTCDSTSCSQRIQCAGDEDRCFNATVNLAGLSTSVKGCATQSVCSGAFSEELDSVATELTCCEGDLCNAKEAKVLECITCASASGPCSGASEECPASDTDSCASITASTTILGRSIAEVNVKSCTPSGECLNGSLNTGTLRRTLSTSCCDTDNCNTERPSAAVNYMPNGRKCFTCLTHCSSRIECAGDEDRCVTGTIISVAGPNATIKGCATQSVCSGAFSDELDLLAVELTCCEGDLCNSACSATHSVLFLLWPLGSVLLFH